MLKPLSNHGTLRLPNDDDDCHDVYIDALINSQLNLKHRNGLQDLSDIDLYTLPICNQVSSI